jgi:predicted phage tail protein
MFPTDTLEKTKILPLSITGSGGMGGGSSGGGKGGTNGGSKEKPDNLFSKAYAEVLFAVSEGQISGPTGDILKSVYLEDTPVQNTDGTFNFTGIDYLWTTGYPGQPTLGYPSQIKKETNVGVEVKTTTPATRTFVSTSATWVMFRLKFPTMLDASDGKGIKPTEVQFRLQINAGSGFVDLDFTAVTGKSNSPFEQSYAYPLPVSATNTWSLRVIRVSADSTSANIQNSIIWEAFTTIDPELRTFPNTALLWVRLQSDQFSSIPPIYLEGRGIIVRVPHNYDVNSRVYAGVFNGTLIPGWTNNPAWILYDMLTDDRYGCAIPDSQIDIYSFYSAAVYCDGLVSDGSGGLEPRYRFNAYVSQIQDAYTACQWVASSMRGNLWWDGFQIRLHQDKPALPTRLYSKANVKHEYDQDGSRTGGGFSYSSTDLTTRYSACTVKFIDPLTWLEDSVYYEDAVGTARYGYRLQEISAPGCTSRSEAMRKAKWEIFTSLYQTRTISFTVATEGLIASPGEICKIADTHRSGFRTSGRIASATTTSITIDDTINFNPLATYQISVVNPTTCNSVDVGLSTLSGNQTVLPLVSTLSFTPQLGSVWILTAIGILEPDLFQVLKVTETGKNEYTIEGVNHNPGKWDYIENNLTLPTIPTTVLPDLGTTLQPIGLQIFENLVESPTGINTDALLLWGQPNNGLFISRWQVDYKKSADTNWTIAGFANAPEFVIENIPNGGHDFRVFAVNQVGVYSLPATASKEILGLSVPPGDVKNFAINAIGENTAIASWDKSADLDVLKGGSIVIKYSSALTGVLWNTAVEIIQSAGNSVNVVVPLMKGTYTAKFFDSSGNESLNAAFSTTTGLDFTNQNVVSTLTENPEFPGVKTNCYVDPLDNSLKLLPSLTWDAVSDIENIANIEAIGSGGFGVILNSGIYEFSTPVNLGRIASCRIVPTIQSVNLDQYNDVEQWPNFDTVSNIEDNQSADDARSYLEIAISQNGSTYDAWRRFQIGEYSGWAFKFRQILESTKTSVNVATSVLSVLVDMPDRRVSDSVVTSNSADTVITFSSPFQVAPGGIDFTIQNSASGDYGVVSAVTNIGFTINIFNSSNVRISRNIRYSAASY